MSKTAASSVQFRDAEVVDPNSSTKFKLAPKFPLRTETSADNRPRKTHQEYIADEFERLARERERVARGGGKKGSRASTCPSWEVRRASLRSTYLTLPQILAFRNSDHLLPVDISHLGVLWVTDRDHDGRITLEDLLDLVDFCKSTMKSYPRQQQHEREAMIQSICTEQLWEDVRTDKGRFVEWIGNLVYEASTQRRRFWRHGGSHVYVETNAVESLWRFMGVGEVLGVAFQGFVDLLQRVGEAEGLMDLFDEEQDDYVVLGIVKEGVGGVYVGATRLLADVAS